MNDRDKLALAYRYGHGWNRSKPDVLNVDASSVKKLTLKHKIGQQIIQSWQEADANLDVLANIFHSRDAVCDGLCGPATDALMALPRCAMPDHPPPPGASFHYDDPNLQAAVESMQRAAAEPAITGPYWRGCDSQRPDVHSLVIGIDARNAPSVFKENQDKILEARRACAAEIGVAVRFVINPSSSEKLQQLQVYHGIPGGVIGMNYFPSSNSCGKIPNGSMDSGYNPSDWRLHANLGTHESEGHGFGFNHTRGGIMNPSIVLVWPLSWKGDAGWSQVTRYYPATPIDPPTPPPPPTPKHPPITGAIHAEPIATGGIAIRGDLTLTIGQERFTYIVKPDGAGKYKVDPKAVL